MAAAQTPLGVTGFGTDRAAQAALAVAALLLARQQTTLGAEAEAADHTLVELVAGAAWAAVALAALLGRLGFPAPLTQAAVAAEVTPQEVPAALAW